MSIIDKVIEKVTELELRYLELQEQSGTPNFHQSDEAPRLLKEMSRLGRFMGPFKEHKSLELELNEYKEALNEDDAELKELSKEEIPGIEKKMEKIGEKLMTMLLTEDEMSDKNVIVEIRAGTGGDEAALFAADIFSMYQRYAETRHWKISIMHASETDKGGFKELIFSLSGELVNQVMKFESGGHRVQRVPTTETSGRVHTSAVTVAVMQEAEEIDIEISPDDIRIDVMRASGAGGQHVNKTESAVRITHLETKIVVYCQEQKSQLKNRTMAMKVLRARLQDHYEQAAHKERSDKRQSMIGSGDRSSKIRTYNFPQNRCTDHRIGLSLHFLDRIMMGGLDELFEALLAAEKEEKIKNF